MQQQPKQKSRTRRIWKFLRRLVWPTPAQHWDWKAYELRQDWFSEEEIVKTLGPRPADDA